MLYNTSMNILEYITTTKIKQVVVGNYREAKILMCSLPDHDKVNAENVAMNMRNFL